MRSYQHRGKDQDPPGPTSDKILWASGMIFSIVLLFFSWRIACAQAVDVLSAAPVAAQNVGPYVLSPDDQVTVSVLDHPELSKDVIIMPDGTINYDVVGTVHAAGLTTAQLTRTLVTGLSRELNQPDVTVTVRESRPRKVSVLGAVHAPGLYDCKAGTHLLDILANCGGLTQTPEMTQATLVTAGGALSKPLDLARLLNAADISQNVTLSPGDILLVTAKDPALASVQVSGEVARPGSFPVPASGITLATLLEQAGGPTTKAALAHVQILHDGQLRVVDVHQSLNQLDGSASRERILPGDVLLVPTNKAQFLAQGEVRSPGVYPIPDGEVVSLTLALTQAGGITSDGDKKNVDIVRQGPDGKPVVVTVNADDLFQGKTTNDMSLKAGDILYVQTRRRHQGVGDVLQSLGPLAVVSTLLRGF